LALFFSANKETRIGVDFLRDGVAVAQVRADNGDLLRADFVEASGQDAQVEALRQWVRGNRLQKTPCVCLVAQDDCDVYQVEKPEVEDHELVHAVTWKIKDLINYDVGEAVVDSYPMPASSRNKQQQVGVVAAHETVIGGYVDGIRHSSMKLTALDVHELVRSNLAAVRESGGRSLALLSLQTDSGLLSVYHDTDLYVSRGLAIGLDRLELAGQDDTGVFDSLLLDIQRSLDYFESYYDIGSVAELLAFPRNEATEKMARYLHSLTSFDIGFLSLGAANDAPLDPHCFHAYCAALRGMGA
jgi:MSHA biogenesis protein MshI